MQIKKNDVSHGGWEVSEICHNDVSHGGLKGFRDMSQ